MKKCKILVVLINDLIIRSCNPAPKAPQTTELKKQLMLLYNAYYPATEGSGAKADLKLQELRKSIGNDLKKIADGIARKMGPDHVSYISSWINSGLYLETST